MLLLAMAMGGCGAFETDDKGKKEDQIDTRLNGRWTSACLDANWLELTHAKEQYVFSALGDFEKSTKVYSDQCQTEVAGLSVTGTYDEVGAAAVEDAQNINFTVRKAELTPKTANLVTALNTTSYCGATDWTLNTAKSILNLDCLGEDLDDGDVLFDIYKLTDNELRLGKQTVWFDLADDSDERPTTLDETRVFTRE